MWWADIEKWVANLAVEGLVFIKVSTKLDIHSLLTGSAAGPLAWSEIDPAHRAIDARGPTKPNFQRPDRAGQRCKCRLVCEWECTVTSVSVRIEKRANCAKNNKPKSGGLFLVNARPFPEHSSSRATFSVGRAWLEASGTTALVLDFQFYHFTFLDCIIFLPFFLQICTFDDSQLLCVMPLNTCNYAQTWWVCFGAVIALFSPLFCLSATLHCIFFRLFFKFCTFDDSSHADQDSTTVSSFLWCHWVPATMHYLDEFLSEL